MSLSASIQEVSSHFSHYISQVEQVEEVIINRFGEPFAKLSAISPTQTKRRLGGGRGVVKSMNEDFDGVVDFR